MSATEMMDLFERAQREGLGDEQLVVTAEQAERLHALIEGQRETVCRATALPQDGRLVLVRV